MSEVKVNDGMRYKRVELIMCSIRPLITDETNGFGIKSLKYTLNKHCDITFIRRHDTKIVAVERVITLLTPLINISEDCKIGEIIKVLVSKVCEYTDTESVENALPKKNAFDRKALNTITNSELRSTYAELLSNNLAELDIELIKEISYLFYEGTHNKFYDILNKEFSINSAGMGTKLIQIQEKIYRDCLKLILVSESMNYKYDYTNTSIFRIVEKAKISEVNHPNEVFIHRVFVAIGDSNDATLALDKTEDCCGYENIYVEVAKLFGDI